jgi:hypothetical protein
VEATPGSISVATAEAIILIVAALRMVILVRDITPVTIVNFLYTRNNDLKLRCKKFNYAGVFEMNSTNIHF